MEQHTPLDPLRQDRKPDEEVTLEFIKQLLQEIERLEKENKLYRRWKAANGANDG